MASPLVGLIEEAPTGPGVYLLVAEGDRLAYVGKAANLRRRLREHARADRRTFRSIVDVRWEETPDERTALSYARLRLVKRLMDAGFRPGRLLAMPLDALQALAQGSPG